jgi:hypothetical protein
MALFLLSVAVSFFVLRGKGILVNSSLRMKKMMTGNRLPLKIIRRLSIPTTTLGWAI